MSFVPQIHRRLDWQDGVEQSSVARRTVGGGDFCVLSGDETFVFQRMNTLCDRVLTQRNGLSDFLIAGVALIGFPVLAVEQVTVHCQFIGGQAQRKNYVWQREVVTAGNGLFKILSSYELPPAMFCSTQQMNCSLGATMRLLIFREGKLLSWSSS